jgi:hypothetical protein
VTRNCEAVEVYSALDQDYCTASSCHWPETTQMIMTEAIGFAGRSAVGNRELP